MESDLRAGRIFPVAALNLRWRQKLLDLRHAKRIAVAGGGLTGWLAALMLRRVFSPNVEIVVLEDPDNPAYSGGEGGSGNFIASLERASIDIDEFVRETDATFKIGNAYHGWRADNANDIFYELFPAPDEHVEEVDFSFRGVWPFLATRIATGTPLHTLFPGFSLVATGASQVEANAVFNLRRSGIKPTFHFNVGKFLKLLKKIALSRQISSRSRKVVEFVKSESGDVVALKLAGGAEISADFIIDATGFERLGAEKAYKSVWRSFSSQLPEDRYLSFKIPEERKNPSLVSAAVALANGYLWQVPLRDHVFVHYVFSGKSGTETQIRQALQSYFGFAVTAGVISTYEAGNFKTVWNNNVVSLGVASGFISPLESSSFAHMLQQLGELERTFIACQGIIGAHTIGAFNEANDRSFGEIADFQRMHFDGGRSDSAFWREAGQAKRSPNYEAMKACFSERLPRIIDIAGYNSGWSPLFHLMNWLFVAAPLGIISAGAAIRDLNYLPPRIMERMQQYGAELMRINAANAKPQWKDSANIEPREQQGFAAYRNYSTVPAGEFGVKPDRQFSESSGTIETAEGNLRATHG